MKNVVLIHGDETSKLNGSGPDDASVLSAILLFVCWPDVQNISKNRMNGLYTKNI